VSRVYTSPDSKVVRIAAWSRNAMKRLRRAFWGALALVFGAAFRFCRRRRARLCPCFHCYVVLNHDRIVREALIDVERELGGRPKVDRRPS